MDTIDQRAVARAERLSLLDHLLAHPDLQGVVRDMAEAARHATEVIDAIHADQHAGLVR